MRLYDSELWFKDIDTVSETIMSELNELAGNTVMITGAAGLICSAIVDILIRYNETHKEKVEILAAGRRDMRDRFKEYFDRAYFKFVKFDSSKGGNIIDIPVNFIIHGASNAFPSAIIAEPVETMASNFTGLLCLLNHAREHKAKRLLYISSSEVYGRKDNNDPYKEDEHGYIDLLNPRNSYSVSKCASETLCASYFAEYGVETVIVRPGHIYGPTASARDNRVSSEFAYAAARGEDIVMKSDGSQLRSYCHCIDCATAILMVLLRGESTCAYNISNPDSVVTIMQMAEYMAEAGGVELKKGTSNEQERKTYNSMQNSSLDSTKLLELGWKPQYDIKNGIERTIKILKGIGDNGKLRG